MATVYKVIRRGGFTTHPSPKTTNRVSQVEVVEEVEAEFILFIKYVLFLPSDE